MTYHPAAHSPHTAPNEPDCLQAEFVSAVEPNHPSDFSPEIAVTSTTESALATFEPTLQTTDSFEFNYVDRPVPPPQELSEPLDSAEILTRLFTPWSLGGLFLLVLANGLLTVYSFSHRAAPPPVAISGFSELPPVNSIPPSLPNSSGPSLAVNHLSEISPPQTVASPTVSSPQPFSPALPATPPSTATAQQGPPLPPPPPTVSLASRLFPPAINPQQAMVPSAPSAAPARGYPTYATARANAPQPPQPPNGLPTVSVRPVYQPQATSPLPPPPPPPLSQTSMGLPAPGINPPTPNAAPVNAPNPPSPPSNTAEDVATQMRQQLPVNQTSGATSASNSANQSNPSPGTKSYNQSPGTTQMGTSPTQQLVQELENLNQAP